MSNLIIHELKCQSRFSNTSTPHHNNFVQCRLLIWFFRHDVTYGYVQYKWQMLKNTSDRWSDAVIYCTVSWISQRLLNICHQNNRIHWLRYTSISTPIIWLGHTILTKHYASYRWWAFSDPVLRARGSYVVTVTHSCGTPEICMEGTQHGYTSIRLLPHCFKRWFRTLIPPTTTVTKRRCLLPPKPASLSRWPFPLLWL